MEQESDFGSVYLRRFDSDGLQSEPVRVGRTDADRNSGFPRLAAMNNGVVVAWTQTVPVMRIRTARLPYDWEPDRKSTRLNSSHVAISYAVFCLKKKSLARSISF